MRLRSVTFTVPGEPVGYLRLTQRQVKIAKRPVWRLISPNLIDLHEKIWRYWNYKTEVALRAKAAGVDIAPKGKTRLDVMIYFSSKRHPDPENVRKGIQDAIFPKDKLVMGLFDFQYTHGEPRCEITVRSEVENVQADELKGTEQILGPSRRIKGRRPDL